MVNYFSIIIFSGGIAGTYNLFFYWLFILLVFIIIIIIIINVVVVVVVITISTSISNTSHVVNRRTKANRSSCYYCIPPPINIC